MSKMTVKSGFKKLDDLLEGGIPMNTNVLLSGGPGTGKTLFCLKFLMQGAVTKEKVCYISLNETKEEIIRATEGIESLKNFKNYLGKNASIEYIKLDQTTTMRKFKDIIEMYPKIDRLVIDNINKLLMFADSKRQYRMQLSNLLKSLKNICKCTILICETNADEIDTGNGEAFESDGIINIFFSELEEKPRRMISVHKLRYSSFEPKIPHEMQITSKDIKITDAKLI